MNKLVPFGKYKGQPVEVLSQDKQYCEWLASQDWLRSRFSGIHTLIVNNFKDAAETPEHNALQAKFTDDAWVRSFVWHLTSTLFLYEGVLGQAEHFARLRDEFTDDGLAKRLRPSGAFATAMQWFQEWQRTLEENTCLVLRILECEFEIKGADVEIDVSLSTNPALIEFTLESRRSIDFIKLGFSCHKTFRIECKPSLGDDYPVVLRQMRANECDILLVGNCYCGTGATLDQVRAIFGDIRIVFVDDVKDCRS